MLTRRLKRVIGSIVANTQSTFILNRNILDEVVIIDEVVDWAKRRNRKGIVFKIDFEKAYDSVKWSFIEYMMRRFGEKWISWIKACVFASSLSILMNGSPTEEIHIKRGLKQGDPLASFLFLLVAEGIGGLLGEAVTKNLFVGMPMVDEGRQIFAVCR